jgi:hypothetical protein
MPNRQESTHKNLASSIVSKTWLLIGRGVYFPLPVIRFDSKLHLNQSTPKKRGENDGMENLAEAKL